MIPAGSFMMGSPSGIGLMNEKPQHLVNIQSFTLGKYTITQKQWVALMGSNPSSNRGENLPVENSTWDDAHLFIQKLSQKTGKKYRLPSEAEWEYAARGGSTAYFLGDNDKLLAEYAWYSENSNSQTHPVGLKRANQFGLYDMLGNVWQWTQDCWNLNYIGAPTDGSAWTQGDCSQRVLRGGAFGFASQNVRFSYRYGNSSAIAKTGTKSFRVARNL